MGYVPVEDYVPGGHRLARLMAYEIRAGDVILPNEHGPKCGDRYIVEEARWGEDGDGDFYLVWNDNETRDHGVGGEFCDPGKQFKVDLTQTYEGPHRT